MRREHHGRSARSASVGEGVAEGGKSRLTRPQVARRDSVEVSFLADDLPTKTPSRALRLPRARRKAHELPATGSAWLEAPQ